MGSEQSTSAGGGAGQWPQRSVSAAADSRVNQFRRGKSLAERSESSMEDHDDSPGNRPGNTSPGPSICSDSDLPYISYTVSRPIGDSPKLSNKQQLQRGRSLGGAMPSLQLQSGSANKNRHSTGGMISGSSQKWNQQAQRPHSIVVVKAAADPVTLEKDTDLVRLQNVPMFLPIMRGTLNLPAARDPEVLERLDPSGTLNLCLRYQQHLALCANAVAADQNQIISKVREIDFETQKLVTSLTERQKKFSKFAEKLQKVRDVSNQLNKCHILLNQTLENIETLNNALPLDDRLEPFVWTTG
ncbi:BLOC-1-related complex subunit 5 isoform X2 [Thrips palmi]|uniref:BLOC-1-related complex subunit 5 n=1 Tax=Thrips palmi TaxID=161013 RepID=A0A6P8ZDD0_THRPL|nr:BLOC-1-related complex subunit 5 isoform X2 [Thrips palmi]